jgi:hypothetical protein
VAREPDLKLGTIGGSRHYRRENESTLKLNFGRGGILLREILFNSILASEQGGREHQAAQEKLRNSH